jgi:uncharacterized protein
MIYRPIGNTGMEASIIGLGAEHLDKAPFAQTEEVIDAALGQGINIIDVFMPGAAVRQNISRALKGRREQVLLQGHIGAVERDGQFDRTREVALCRKYVEEFLKHFNTDYIDLGMMFFIDTEEDYKKSFESDYIDYVLKLRQQGTIRAVGASTHNPITAAKMVESGLVDMIMFSINPAYDMLPASFNIYDAFGDKFNEEAFEGIEPARARLYELCAQRNVAITVMKTLGAGRLLSADQTPFTKPLTVGQCIHYALTRPAVVSTLIGCRSAAEVEEACLYLTLSDEEKDYSLIAKNFRDTLSGKCMYCNHCLPCPSQIDIGALTKLLDIARIDENNIPPSIRQHYNALTSRASDCIQCGNCEANCPFGVPVMANMRSAVQLLER